MSSSIFGAEQRISEPLSALAVLTGRHREKNTRDPVLVNSQRVNEINESTIYRGRMVYCEGFVVNNIKSPFSIAKVKISNISCQQVSIIVRSRTAVDVRSTPTQRAH